MSRTRSTTQVPRRSRKVAPEPASSVPSPTGWRKTTVYSRMRGASHRSTVRPAWLNSEPLTPEGLRGRVVLVDFWTYTCVNWLRTLPYVRAWASKYEDAGLTVVGVHTPEFGFESDIDNVVAQTRNLGVEYPVAVDSGYRVWGAFANRFWPAVYIADAEGRIRHHHFGEGEYPQTEMVIQRLLLDAGARDLDLDLVAVEPRGLEVAADWQVAAITRDLPRIHPEQRLRVGGNRAARPAARVHRGFLAATQLLGPLGKLDGRPARRRLERTRRTDRVPVPRPRPQPRHGPAGRGRLDPVPGHPRRPTPPETPTGPTWTPTAAGSSAIRTPTSSSASPDRSRTAGSRSNSSKPERRSTASPSADRGREREHEHLTEHREKDGLTRSCTRNNVSPNQSHGPCDYERGAPDGSTRPHLRSEGRTRTRA